MPNQLSSLHQQILRQQQITENEPGTILHDFRVFMDFIAAHRIKATGKNHLLPLRTLADLNSRFSHPLDIKLQRPQQKSFPHINGLYLIARAAGLLRMHKSAKDPILFLDAEVMNSWLILNSTERYFALLEAWLARASMEMLGERQRWQDMLSDVRIIWRRIPDTGSLKVAGVSQLDYEFSGERLTHIALLELFGLIWVAHGESQVSQGWVIEEIRRTPFGQAVFATLAQRYPEERYTIDFIPEKYDENVIDLFHPLFQPYFPELTNGLRLGEPHVFRDGVYTFKVELDRNLWRRITIPAGLLLDDLSDAIREAYEFDDDHLYRFIYENRVGLKRFIYHPLTLMNEYPSTDQTRVGDLPLQAGEMMIYNYDFGDNWEFPVTLEKIDPPDREMKRAQIIESKGKAPEQYPTWGEDEDEWM